MNDINFNDFEMVVSSRGNRTDGTGYGRNPHPVMRMTLHSAGVRKDGKPNRKQLSIALNAALMKASRFVSGDLVNVAFSKDRAMMMIERHPKGQWTLSPIGADKTDRDAAIGKAKTSAVKFSAPDWAVDSQRLEDGFLIEGNDLVIDGSRVLAQVNLA